MMNPEKATLPPHNGASAHPYYPELPVRPAPEPLNEEAKIRKYVTRREARRIALAVLESATTADEKTVTEGDAPEMSREELRRILNLMRDITPVASPRLQVDSSSPEGAYPTEAIAREAP
jgi:hypothetical protein